MKTLYQHKAEYIREVYKKTGSVKEAAKVLDCVVNTKSPQWEKIGINVDLYQSKGL